MSGVSLAESPTAWLGTLVPGIVLCGLIAAAALLLRQPSGLTALGPLIVSIALGALSSPVIAALSLLLVKLCA